MPWSAHPTKDGSFWVPYYGRANKIARLDPTTAEIKEFPVPNVGTAAIHSAVPAPDGSPENPRYRIKNMAEKHERVASEHELTASPRSESAFSSH